MGKTPLINEACGLFGYWTLKKSPVRGEMLSSYKWKGGGFKCQAVLKVGKVNTYLVNTVNTYLVFVLHSFVLTRGGFYIELLIMRRCNLY